MRREEEKDGTNTATSIGCRVPMGCRGPAVRTVGARWWGGLPGLLAVVLLLPATASGQDHERDEGAKPGRTQHGPAASDHAALPVREIPPEKAKQLITDNKYVLLDVRTKAEFKEIHVPGALNIPVVQFDAATGARVVNPAFLEKTKAAIPPDTPVVVMCRSGRRSAKASKMMKQAGYGVLFNMLGGMNGFRDESGKVVQPGWATLGYPVHKAENGKPGCTCGQKIKKTSP